MHRFSKISFLFIIVAVFFSGVYCGILWNSAYPRLPDEPLFANASSAHGDAPDVVLAMLPDTQSPLRLDKKETLAANALESGSPEYYALYLPVSGNLSDTPINTVPSSEFTAPDAFLDGFIGTEKMPFFPPSSFSLHRLGTGDGPTLLIIGGIQGDEPGGFSAAALIASHYKIREGSVWVVPDLNFASILLRGRGVHGDMNRKFADLDPKDPQYDIITQIKSVLLDERVALVLNLHDGSGFYRPTWEDALRNPRRWGQSLIIDQEKIDAPRFNMLYEIASMVMDEVNQTLLDPVHRYHIHNTLTAKKNTTTAKEMTQTLSYFAICNGKPAFGVEASKEFTTEYRAYYHLHVIESFMRQMDIKFERDFDLSPRGVRAALNSNLKVAAYDNRWMLPLDNARPTISGFLPFKKDAEPDIRTSKPLLTIVPDKGQPTWRVAYGNRTLTRVNPEFMDFDDSLDSVDMLLDGEPYKVRMGDMVTVRDSFLVKSVPGFRVTAIGALKEAETDAAAHKNLVLQQPRGKKKHQADLSIAHRDFMPRFSLDRNGTTYRVELYKDDAFAGMILVRFNKESSFVTDDAAPLTAVSGPESALGF